MKIILNNNTEIIKTEKSQLTIRELLTIKNFTFTRLVVKINGKVIKKNEYESAIFEEGDKVDIIHQISGG